MKKIMPNLPTSRELRLTRIHEPVADLPDDFRYGIGAGIALAQGDRATARQFVQRAAQCDCQQCYKLLWLRSLEPILNWLAAELLTEDSASLAATEDGELRLLATRIQCLAIRGHNTEARALAQRVYEDVFAGQNFYNYRR